MADDVQVPPNSTGQIVKAIDIGGKVYQVVILSDSSGNVVGVTTNAVDSNPIDRALRDNGKVDIAAFDAELPAGTQNIGDVDVATIAAGDNNIGNVDIASEIPAGTQNIGDVDVLTTPADATDGAVHGASQKGFRAMGSDGTNDQQVAVDASGNVQVDIVADAAGLATAANQLADGHNVTVDNAGAGAAVNIQDGGNSITVDGTVTADAGTGPWPVTDNAGSLTVDTVADSTDGAAHGVSQTGLRAMGSDGTNDQQIAVDASGNVQVDIVSDGAGLATSAGQLANGHDVTVDNAAGASAVNIQDGGNTITVDGTVTADAGTGPFPVSDNAGSLTVDAPVGTPVNAQISDGTDTALVSAGGALSVSIDAETASVTVDQATASNLNAQAVGDAAHDAADSGNPIKLGGKASTNEPTAVAVDDRVNAWFDTFGRLVTVGGHASPETPVAVNATASGVTQIIAAPGAGVSLHICKGSINNGGAAVLNAGLRQASGSNVWEMDLAADGGGALFDFGERGWKLTANTALQVDLGAAGDAWINVTEYYIAA
jgi:hypothetical protein